MTPAEKTLEQRLEAVDGAGQNEVDDRPLPSVSMNGTIRLDGKRYRIDFVGFTEIESLRKDLMYTDDFPRRQPTAPLDPEVEKRIKERCNRVLVAELKAGLKANPEELCSRPCDDYLTGCKCNGWRPENCYFKKDIFPSF